MVHHWCDKRSFSGVLFLSAGVIASHRRRRGNLNVLRIPYPQPIGHAGTPYYEIPTVAPLPRNDTVMAGYCVAKRYLTDVGTGVPDYPQIFLTSMVKILKTAYMRTKRAIEARFCCFMDIKIME